MCFGLRAGAPVGGVSIVTQRNFTDLFRSTPIDRFDDILRNYTADDVVRLRGSVDIKSFSTTNEVQVLEDLAERGQGLNLVGRAETLEVDAVSFRQFEQYLRRHRALIALDACARSCNSCRLIA